MLRESEYGKGAVTSGGLQLEFEQLLPTLSTDEVNSNPNPNPNPNSNANLSLKLNPDPSPAQVNSIRRLWKFIAPAPGCGTAGRNRWAASLGVIDWHREVRVRVTVRVTTLTVAVALPLPLLLTLTRTTSSSRRSRPWARRRTPRAFSSPPPTAPTGG